MKTGEMIKMLVTAENYAKVRCTISDEFIDFMRDYFPRDYGYIEEKEQAYQNILKLFNNGATIQFLE